MKTFKSTSTSRPKTVAFHKHYVDVNIEVEEFIPKPKKHSISEGQPAKMFRYTTTRYTTNEYLEKLTRDSDNTAQAVAELTDLYVGGGSQ